MATLPQAPYGTLFPIPGDLLDDLRVQSLAGLKALSRRGIEVGGFLSAPREGGRADAFSHVNCEYSFGPSYVLSAIDLSGFGGRVDEVRAEGRTTVAFFRSCTRDEMRLGPEDLQVIAEQLPEVRFALMAQPHLDGTVQFGLFHKMEDGSWLGPQNPEYPEVAAFQAVEERPRIRVVPDRMPAEAIPAVAEPETPIFVKRRVRNWALWVALATLVAAVTLVWSWTQKKAAPVPAELEAAGEKLLGLRVEPEGSSFRVTWDRNFVATTKARGAVLKIQDGLVSRDVILNSAESARGSIVYTPHSNDVTFELQARLDGRPGVSEIVRVLNGAGPPQVPTVSSTLADAPVTIHAPDPKVAVVKKPDRPAVREIRAAETLLPKPEPIVPAAATRQMEPAAVALDQPQVGVQPQPMGRPNQKVESVSRPRLPMVSRFAPPVPTRSVMPTTTGIPWNVNGPVNITIRVTVDASGEVIAARELPDGTRPNLSLVGASLRAAKQWRFTPAMRDGTPAEAEHNIVFHFRTR